MRALKSTIHPDDVIKTENEPPICKANKQRKLNTNDIAKLFPGIIPVSKIPPSSTKFSFPFKLSDTTIVRQKPYYLSREKRLWLQEELQGILNSGVIRPSDSESASPVKIAPKEDNSWIFCTDY